MKLPALLTLLVGCWLVTGCQHGPPLSKEQEQRYGELLRLGKVRTDFHRGTKLSVGEQIEVMALADRCGVQDVGKITTKKMALVEDSVIVVDGVDRLDGRDRIIDRVAVYRADATWGPDSDSPSFLRIGRFCAEADQKRVLRFRIFKFWGAPAEISMPESMDPMVADRIIGLLATNEVQYSDPSGRTKAKFERYPKSGVRPAALEVVELGNSFVLSFNYSDVLDGVLHFRLEDGTVVIDRLDASYRLF
jgi:hypothetical protein